MSQKAYLFGDYIMKRRVSHHILRLALSRCHGCMSVYNVGGGRRFGWTDNWLRDWLRKKEER